MQARRAYSKLRNLEPPAIVRAHFEFNGEVLASYDAVAIAAIGGKRERPPLICANNVRAPDVGEGLEVQYLWNQP
jgi:hypothetical protein